jgi:hypothetical protein
MKDSNSTCLQRQPSNYKTKSGQLFLSGTTLWAVNIQTGPEPRSQGHQVNPRLSREHEQVVEKLLELYSDLFLHDGFGSIIIEMKFLKKGQKEIIISSGKDYRFVVDWPEPAEKV